MYKATSYHQQRGAGKIGIDDIQITADWSSLPPEEERRSVQAAIARLNEQLKETPDDSQNRPPLIARKRELEARSSELKAMIKTERSADIKLHFIEVAKEQLPKPIFERIKAEATRRALRGDPA